MQAPTLPKGRKRHVSCTHSCPLCLVTGRHPLLGARTPEGEACWCCPHCQGQCGRWGRRHLLPSQRAGEKGGSKSGTKSQCPSLSSGQRGPRGQRWPGLHPLGPSNVRPKTWSKAGLEGRCSSNGQCCDYCRRIESDTRGIKRWIRKQVQKGGFICNNNFVISRKLICVQYQSSEQCQKFTEGGKYTSRRNPKFKCGYMQILIP